MRITCEIKGTKLGVSGNIVNITLMVYFCDGFSAVSTQTIICALLAPALSADEPYMEIAFIMLLFDSPVVMG